MLCASPAAFWDENGDAIGGNIPPVVAPSIPKVVSSVISATHTNTRTYQ